LNLCGHGHQFRVAVRVNVGRLALQHDDNFVLTAEFSVELAVGLRLAVEDDSAA
jgi:hypothetical protein